MRSRSESGQASVEHVGLIALVALVLLAAGAVAAEGAPSIVNGVVSGVQRSLCVVTGEACVTLARQPCPTLRTSKTIGQGVTVASLHLGHDRVLFIERHSDGTYAMTLVSGLQGGVQIESGVERGVATAAAEASGDLGYHLGRTYTAQTPEEARALVARLRSDPDPQLSTIVAGAADLAGLAKSDPEVSSYVVAGTGAGKVLGKVGLGGFFDVGVQANISGELGVRIATHQPQVTAYVKADTSIGAFFNVLNNITAPIEHTPGSGETLTGKVSVKNPATVRRQENAVGGGSISLQFGPGPTLQQIEIVGYEGVSGTKVVTGATGTQREVHVRLDPSDPAVQQAIDTWRHAPTSAASYEALGRAAAQSAAIDVRDYATTDTQGSHEHGGSVGIEGVTFGVTYGSRSKVSDLLGESSRPPGGLWEHRLDCEPG